MFYLLGLCFGKLTAAASTFVTDNVMNSDPTNACSWQLAHTFGTTSAFAG